MDAGRPGRQPRATTWQRWLRNDLASPGDVVPNDVPIQIGTCAEEDAPSCRLRDLVRKAHVFLRLIPVGEQKDIDGDPFAGAELRFPQGRRLGARVRRVQQEEEFVFEM